MDIFLDDGTSIAWMGATIEKPRSQSILSRNKKKQPMKVAKNDVDVQLDIPGATLRQRMNFGDATGLGKISGEYFSLGAGLDSTDLFKGLEGDMCQSPHWGYVLHGQITTTDSSGKQETVKADDLFYWPPGHNIRVDEDADFIMFSPQHEHTHVINHLREKVTG